MPTAASRLLVPLVVVTLLGTGVPHLWAGIATANAAPDHLVISEVVAGGTSASDEFIELYNPTNGPLPLEGLELVYVSASGLTVSRRAAWELGAPEVPPGGHVLIANELGIYAPIADAAYASGMAATGGSVALRIVGAASAIDAVGWGSATSAWLEGTVAPAPPAGSSLERLPGGALGSTRDTDDNAADFVVRPIPGPENSASPPVPSASGSPQPSVTASASPSIVSTQSPTAAPTVPPTASPTPTPGAVVVSIATARALPDGTEVTIEGVALTGADFADGGGHVADDSGGVAVLVSDGSFARGDRLRVSGLIDDRYAQRTLRADGADVVVLGTAADPTPTGIPTGSVGEGVESRLVRIAGTIVGSPTALSAGVAFDVDDGSGPVRLLIGSTTGIDIAAWGLGFQVDAIGVVGQRDSSGTGVAGYRVQPRDVADILTAGPAPSPTPSPEQSATPESTPLPSPSADVISVAAARQLPKGSSAVVRGVVTLAPGLVDPTTAALQDASGAIVLRIGDDVGPIVRGSLVEVRGVRSTLSGMETLRVTTPPRTLGAAAEPAARPVRTGEAGEADEAILVTARGGLVAAPRRSSAGTISFEIDDGSGPLRVSIGSGAGIDASQLVAGTWIEVRGVLGQETTGSLPLRGYRIWPRAAADLHVTAPASATSGTGSTGGGEGSTTSGGADLETLDGIGGAAAGGLPIGATLVVGPWEDLGFGGLLWDGTRLVALRADAEAHVVAILGGRRPPVAVQATGLRIAGTDTSTGISVAALSNEPGALSASGQPISPPVATVHTGGGEARWVTLVGRLAPSSEAAALLVGDTPLPIDPQCNGEPMPRPRTVSVTGILVGDPERLVVPCGGIEAAPTLHRLTAHAALTPAALTGALGRRGADPRPEPLPAMLLLLAAASLVAGAASARWLSPDGPPGPASGEVAAEVGDEVTPPPALTLVPMPHERAP